MAIITLQVSLWMELLYPAMTILLITTHLKDARSLTHLVLNLIGATVGCAAAIALAALFIQQPWFYLSVMFVMVTALVYFMVSSRYRGSYFCCAYLFIVACFMIIFDKEHAEQQTLMVFRSGAIGVIISGLAHVFLWPRSPATLLREQLAHLLSRPIESLSGLATSTNERRDAPAPAAEVNPFRISECIETLERAETDAQFQRGDRPSVMALIGAVNGLANAVDSAARALAGSRVDPERTLRTIEAASRTIRALRDALNDPGRAGAFAMAVRDAVAELNAREIDPRVQPLADAVRAVGEARAALDGLVILDSRPDTASVLIGNLRGCLAGVCRERFVPLNDRLFAHAAKCALAVMICLLFCVTLNWSHGIGCVETIMLVVQATLGGTVVIGLLRLFGVVVAVFVAVGVVIFIMPTITTLPGLLLVFGPLLLLVGYGMGASERATTPAVQVMIVVDFALLQVPRPSIDLFPVMNFSLAVALGVVVSFIVYHFIWRVRAAAVIPSVIAAMESEVERTRELAAREPLTPSRFWQALARTDAQHAQLVRLHEDARIDSPGTPLEESARLDAISAAHASASSALIGLMPRVSRVASGDG